MPVNNPFPNALSRGIERSLAGMDPSGAVGTVFRDALKDGCEGPQMVVLPTGSFRMGSPSGEAGCDSDEGPLRTVNISQRIGMGRYEVTFADYDRYAENWGFLEALF